MNEDDWLAGTLKPTAPNLYPLIVPDHSLITLVTLGFMPMIFRFDEILRMEILWINTFARTQDFPSQEAELNEFARIHTIQSRVVATERARGLDIVRQHLEEMPSMMLDRVMKDKLIGFANPHHGRPDLVLAAKKMMFSILEGWEQVY